jgi:hypothetical protein
MRCGVRSILTRWLPIGLAVLLAAPPLPRAQQPGGDAPPFTREQLEQIVAPIALYPDPLVAHIMMASTYPLEVIQAARFAKANPSLKDTALNDELKKYTWDDSVKALVSFPQVLEMMDKQLEWMQKLGDAVLAQQKETMDAIQRLRAKAQSAGNLKSTEQQKVTVQGSPPAPQTIIIEPARPDVIYVPTYDPTVVYGVWPYPAYPPYYYYPPYYPYYGLGYAALWFGAGMLIGGAIWGNCNWGGGNIDVEVDHHNNFNRNVNRGDRVNPLSGDRGSGARGDRGSWQHNPEHRKGAQYRDRATQQKFNRAGDSARVASRESFRGRAEQGRQDLGRGGGTGSGQRGGGLGQNGARPSRGGEGAIGLGISGQGGAGGGRAFQGVGQGQNQRSFSERGQSSRGGSYGGGSFSGGGSRGGSYSGSGGSRGGGFSGGGGRGGGGGRR